MRVFATVCLLCCIYIPVMSIEYHILALVPLSGSESTRGWAQWQGIKLGIEEALHTVNDVTDVKATFSVNDTACDPLKEQELILHTYWHLPPGRHLIVIGGGCSPISQHVSLGALYSSIPQLTFEEIPIHEHDTPVLSPVSLRVNVLADVYADVAWFIQRQQWQQVVLVYDENNEDSVQATKALHNNHIQVSLSLELSSLYQHSNVLRKSRLRVVVLTVYYEEASDIICSHYLFDPVGFSRYVWLLVVTNVTEAANTLQENCSGGHRPSLDQVVLFHGENVNINNKVSQVFSHVVSNDLTLTSDPVFQVEAGYSYDATNIILDSIRAIGGTVSTTDNTEVTANVAAQITGRRWIGVTGTIEISEDGQRHAHIEIYRFIDVDGHYQRLTTVDRDRETATMEGNMESDTVGTSTRLEGVPLSLFVVMCALATIGIIYAIAMIVFNIVKHRHRAIKMTSPNINVVIMLGCCGVYGTMVMLGLDTTRISRTTMEKLLQATTYMITMGFSAIYGLMSAKSWRVFMIFKNLSTNGKMTRDEHLLLGLFFMVLLDLAVLIPWHLVDPITCSRKAIYEVFEPSNMTDTTIEIDVCNSEYQSTWIAVIYVYKLIILGLGFFFSWQTRHVTLPALRDTRMVYVTICLVITMALVALPVLLIPSTGVVLTYAVGSLLLWMTVTLTITLLFLTKVFLYRKEAKRVSHGESFRFQFSESMKRTQEAIRKLAGCLCCGSAGEDKYAQEMLLTEIECLKRTIRDKDTTIRELNDRLYVGAQKFHDYLKNPKRQQTTIESSERNTSLVPKLKTADSNTANNVQVRQNHVHTGHNNAREPVKLNHTDTERVVIRSGSSRDIREIKDVRHNSDFSPNHIHQYDPRRGYQYSSLPRSHDERERYHQRERRPSGHSVHSYHGNEALRVTERPIYTIDIHSGPRQTRAPVEVHNTPVSTRGQQHPGVYYHEKHSPNSSTNFDSAIDNNSPSSASSNDSFADPNWRNQRNRVPVMNINNETIKEESRPRDVSNGDIDLEAIENEAANSHRYWPEKNLSEMDDYNSRGHPHSSGHSTHAHNMEQGRAADIDQYRTRHSHGIHKHSVSQI